MIVPEYCYAAVLEDVGKFKYKKIRLRELKDNEVLIKVKIAGICGSDIPRVYKKGAYIKNLVIGHEFAGIINSVRGKDINLIGKRVAVYPLIPCRQCKHCNKEEPNLCVQYDYLGSRNDGGFSEYVIVPIENIVPIPDELSFEEASLIEPLAVTYHAIKKIDDIEGKNVLILGLGTMGMLAGQWAKVLGANKVIGIDRNKFKIDIASKLNFSDAFLPKSNLNEKISKLEINIIIECSGDPKLINSYIPLLEKKGTILFIANFERGINFDPKAMSCILRGELNIIGSWNSIVSASKNEWETCIKHLSSKRISITPIITHKFPFSEIVKVFDKIYNKEINFLKCVLYIR